MFGMSRQAAFKVVCNHTSSQSVLPTRSGTAVTVYTESHDVGCTDKETTAGAETGLTSSYGSVDSRLSQDATSRFGFVAKSLPPLVGQQHYCLSVCPHFIG
ncbi:hypothetical protein J6590_013028 [Homalodisca vitripennis]|nr:hypothetical protein J6590_013028 [Homalodisca vitripennis]